MPRTSPDNVIGAASLRKSRARPKSRIVGRPERAHHDVAGLDVAVDDPRRVRRVQRTRTLLDQGRHSHDRIARAVLRRRLARSALVRIRQRDRPGRGTRPLPRRRDQLREGLAIEEPHHDVVKAFVLPCVEHGADARMVDLRGGFGLAREPGEHLRRGGQGAGHHLERDLPREPRVLREEHDALASAPDLPQETVWTDQPAGFTSERGRRERRGGRQADLVAGLEDFGVIGGDPGVIARKPGEIIPERRHVPVPDVLPELGQKGVERRIRAAFSLGHLCKI